MRLNYYYTPTTHTCPECKSSKLCINHTGKKMICTCDYEYEIPQEEEEDQSHDTLQAAAVLLREVFEEHADENSVNYNECGSPMNDCEWCRLAKKWLELNSTILENADVQTPTTNTEE